jgi:hypothetical protein
LLLQLPEWNASGINAFGIFRRICNIYSYCHQCGWMQTYWLWNVKSLDNFVLSGKTECRFTFKWGTWKIKWNSRSTRLCRISFLACRHDVLKCKWM